MKRIFYSKEVKEQAVTRLNNGENINKIAVDLNITSIQYIYKWNNMNNNKDTTLKTVKSVQIAKWSDQTVKDAMVLIKEGLTLEQVSNQLGVNKHTLQTWTSGYCRSNITGIKRKIYNKNINTNNNNDINILISTIENTIKQAKDTMKQGYIDLKYMKDQSNLLSGINSRYN